MEFFDFTAAYDVARRRNKGLTPRHFLHTMEQDARRQYVSKHQQNVEVDRFRAEIAWLELGRPYYKIWPEILPLLTGVEIDVPVDYLRVPFDAFVLRLPQTGNELFVDQQHPVRSIMVVEGVGSDGCRVIVLWIDIGEYAPGGIAMLSWARLSCLPGRSIEEAFAGAAPPPLPGLRVTEELKARCLRLAVSVCFLSTGTDRLVEPDVLSKDLAAYVEACLKGNEANAKTIQNRAIRRGKHGWSVGQYERLRTLVRHPNSQSADETACRGQLTRQHQRRAHFRLLGSGRVTFVRQATVRPDLPPPGHSPGYGIS